MLLSFSVKDIMDVLEVVQLDGLATSLSATRITKTKKRN